jgi:Ca2+-binding EF-hand superfamily protein
VSQELVLALSDLCRGPADKKLRWAFHIYDVDGDGVISRTELEDVALSINELMGECGNAGVDPIVSSATVRLWVDRIFQVTIQLVTFVKC